MNGKEAAAGFEITIGSGRIEITSQKPVVEIVLESRLMDSYSGEYVYVSTGGSEGTVKPDTTTPVTGPGPDSNSVSAESAGQSNTHETGDQQHPFFYIIMVILSLAVIISVYCQYRKRKAD